MKISQPTPELQVPDVRAAQEYYRDKLGFEIAWYNDDGRIGAVSHGDCAIFFRETSDEPAPATFWVFCEELEEAYADLAQRGADVDGPPSDKPWGMRQFTVCDSFGHRFYFFHDL